MSDLQSRVRELATLNAIHDALNRAPSFSEAAQSALDRLVDLVGVSTGWVFTTTALEGDVHAGGFRLSACTGLPAALAADDRAALRCGSCDCQGLFSRGRLERGVNMVTCSRLAGAAGDRGGLEIHASVPLLAPAGPIGILNLAAPGERRFDDETLSFLAAVGKAMGTAFERSRLQDERTDEARYAAALEERHRLAREMHDTLSQLLFAADLSLRTAQAQAGGAVEQQALDRAATMLEEAQHELGALVEVLRPPDLRGGLSSALVRLAKRTGETVPVHLEVDEGAAKALAPAAAEALYRIAQEALHNALKHADATAITVRLSGHPGSVEMTVSDDGVGMSPDAPAGLGLSGMRERAEGAGGQLAVEAARGGGTTVRVRLERGREDG